MSNEEKSKTNSEFFSHKERKDGTKDLYFGKLGDQQHGHAIIGNDGKVKYLRESDGRIIADDKK